MFNMLVIPNQFEVFMDIPPFSPVFSPIFSSKPVPLSAFRRRRQAVA